MCIVTKQSHLKLLHFLPDDKGKGVKRSERFLLKSFKKSKIQFLNTLPSCFVLYLQKKVIIKTWEIVYIKNKDGLDKLNFLTLKEINKKVSHIFTMLHKGKRTCECDNMFLTNKVYWLYISESTNSQLNFLVLVIDGF